VHVFLFLFPILNVTYLHLTHITSKKLSPPTEVHAGQLVEVNVFFQFSKSLILASNSSILPSFNRSCWFIDWSWCLICVISDDHSYSYSCMSVMVSTAVGVTMIKPTTSFF
jgi:hypothetical protein